jgi:hypothetical protein
MACTYASMHADRLIVILSDSQSAIQAVSNPLITSRTVLQTTEALNDLDGQGKEVCLKWVGGHNGTEGNVIADIMANRGAALEISGPEPFLPFSHTHAKKAEKDALLETWTNLWHKIPERRQTKMFMPNPDIPLSKNLLGHTKQVGAPTVPSAVI